MGYSHMPYMDINILGKIPEGCAAVQKLGVTFKLYKIQFHPVNISFQLLTAGYIL